MSTQLRQPKGVPTGGEFAASHHAEAGDTLVDLDDDFPVGQYVHDSIMDSFIAAPPDPNFTPEAPRERERGITVVASADEPRTSETRDGVTILSQRISLAGEPTRRAANKATASRIARSEQVETTRNELQTLADDGAQASMLCVDKRGAVEVVEGRLFNGSDGVIVLPKGKKRNGYRLTTDSNEPGMQVIAVRSGYGHASGLAGQFNTIKASMPTLGPVTADDVPDTADSLEEPPNEIVAAYIYDHPGFGDGETPGCVFFATDRTGENIVNGYMVASGERGLVSEHGSIRVADLERRGGRVVGFRPGALSFRDAMELGDRTSGWDGGEDDIESVWDAVAKASR